MQDSDDTLIISWPRQGVAGAQPLDGEDEQVAMAFGLTFVLTRLHPLDGCPVCDLSAVRHRDVPGGTNLVGVTS
jgi:hypothetical protein